MEKNYCSSFMNHVGCGGDPHECWQEDGFWPERVSADLCDLYVWACELSLSYCGGHLIGYLEYISGRMLPEMLEGFKVLDCPQCSAIAQAMLVTFGDKFPRVDNDREEFVRLHEASFAEFNSTLWVAWKADEFDRKSRSYYEQYCLLRGIPPWGNDNNSTHHCEGFG